jgi:hypothetical protein
VIRVRKRERSSKSGNAIMMQAKKPHDDNDQSGPVEEQEICGYIFDLLGSLETIASQHRLPRLARLIAEAKSEADYCR